MTTLRPGEIYWADIPGGGRHPVIVVSAEKFNRGGYVTVVQITSERFEPRRRLLNCVPFCAGECGMRDNCVAQCENILTIDTDEDLDIEFGVVGILNGQKLRELIRAIGYVIEADCEPAPHNDQ